MFNQKDLRIKVCWSIRVLIYSKLPLVYMAWILLVRITEIEANREILLLL